MLLLTALSLTLCATPPIQSSDRRCAQPVTSDPLEIPAWPEAVPLPPRTPGAITLQPSTAHEIQCRIELLHRMPALCRRDCARQVEATDDAWGMVIDAEPSGWPTWAIAVVGGISAVAGVVLGVWAGGG